MLPDRFFDIKYMYGCWLEEWRQQHGWRHGSESASALNSLASESQRANSKRTMNGRIQLPNSNTANKWAWDHSTTTTSRREQLASRQESSLPDKARLRSERCRRMKRGCWMCTFHGFATKANHSLHFALLHSLNLSPPNSLTLAQAPTKPLLILSLPWQNNTKSS